MKKQYLLIGLLLIAVFIFASCAKKDEKPSKDLDYVIDKETDFVKITGRGDCHDAKIVIPNKIKGRSVTGIASEAFKDDLNLTGITIPDSVTDIGERAFLNCSDLTNVTIPNSVTKIEESAFAGCEELKSITIPNGVTKIEGSAFSGCLKLESITIPNSVTSIEIATFNHCESLTSITIPNSVTSIGDLAFFNCSGLTNITIPNGVTSIGSSVFSNCSSLTSITIPNSVTNIGNNAFYNCNNLQYNEYDNAKYLGNKSNPYLVLVEARDTSITSCIISEQTMIIMDSALNCYNLKSITIPNNVTRINNSAFFFLESITYQGTQEEWNAISKADDWNGSLSSDYTIHCSDGDIVYKYNW